MPDFGLTAGALEGLSPAGLIVALIALVGTLLAFRKVWGSTNNEHFNTAISAFKDATGATRDLLAEIRAERDEIRQQRDECKEELAAQGDRLGRIEGHNALLTQIVMMQMAGADAQAMIKSAQKMGVLDLPDLDGDPDAP